MPVFIVLGAGGTASLPKEMFIIPLNALSQHEVPKNFIQPYKRRSAGNTFYFDVRTKILT
jgi:hypothetical protein